MIRRLFLVAALLVAGAVVNVAVAWSCWRGIRGFGEVTKLRFGQTVKIAEDLGVPSQLQAYESAYRILRFVRWDGGTTIESGFGTTFDTFRIHQRCDHDEALDFHALKFPVGPAVDGRRVQVGWPALALRGYKLVEYTGGVISSMEYRWALSGKRGKPPFPLRPSWRGFVVNTAFYAGTLGLLISGFFTLRRLARIRRGLCPACRYPAGESARCSECGRLLPGRLVYHAEQVMTHYQSGMPSPSVSRSLSSARGPVQPCG